MPENGFCRSQSKSYYPTSITDFVHCQSVYPALYNIVVEWLYYLESVYAGERVPPGAGGGGVAALALTLLLYAGQTRPRRAISCKYNIVIYLLSIYLSISVYLPIYLSLTLLL